MDYNDNDFQSQNLKLAGEGSTKFPPVLRPYALPKFDFDDSLPGHLRFDSLVETEVFLGIESNEDNQWIEEFSRGSSGIEFRTSAAESCSITRHNNVWSEATSSESVEMLLKSVGQEENIPGKTITRESDACDELGCLIKQMERGSKNDDSSLSKASEAIDVQPALPQNEALGNFSGSKEDVVGGQPLADVSSQKYECERSVDGGLNDPISDTISQKGISPPANENDIGDEMKVDTLVESSSGRTEEESAASRMQFNSIVTAAQDTNVSSVELIGQDVQQLKNDINENVDVLLTEKVEQGLGFGQEAEMIAQNLGVNLTERGSAHSGNPLCLASRIESVGEGPGVNATEGSTDIAGEPSERILKGELLEGSNEDAQGGKSGNQVLLKEFEISDSSKVYIHEASSVPFEHDNSFERPRVDISNADDSKAPLLLVNESKVSEGKGDGSSSGYVEDLSTLNVECSTTELLGESSVALTTKGVNDDSGIHREDSNAEVNVSSYVQGDSTEINEENIVTKQIDVCKCNDDNSLDVKETTEFPSNSSNIDREVGGCLIIDKEVGSSSLGQSSKADELVVSQSHTDAVAIDESALENVDLVSCNSRKSVQLDSSGAIAKEAAVIHQEVQVMDACNEESQNTPQVVLNEVKNEGTKEMKACPAVPGSTREVDGAEAQVISEKCEGGIVKENYEKTSSKVSDAEPIPMSSDMLTQPFEGIPSATVQNDQEDNHDILSSEDKSFQQIDVPHTDGGALKLHEGSISSTPFSESDPKFCDMESGSSGADLDKPTCGSPTVIRAAEVSLSKSEKKVVEGSMAQSILVSEDIDGDANKLQSVSPNLKGNDASQGEKSFTFEVSSLAESSEREAGKSWQPFSTVQVTTVPLIVEGSPSSSGIGQLNSSTVQDISRGGLRMLDKENVRSGSKGTSERKTRRASNKGTGKDSAKKGNAVKDTATLRKSEKGEKANNVSLSPSGICQLVQSSELQHYGHVDSSSVKPFGVLATSASTLPDLNSSSSAVFQQPFTDMQQVQLRAQIFVYGALIQGTAPDEAYMISAFGGPDGGKSVWETAWRACMERHHGQNPVLNNAETPLQSRPGTRTTDRAIKHVANQGKVSSSPLGRSSTKGTPSTIINPLTPLSSPLWSIPTPSVDNLQSGGISRSAVMDYQQALSPLQPHQTPPLRNFVGHNSSWISQAPFRGPWVAPPQSSAFDANARFPVLPITETVHLTPVKETSVPHSSGAKHLPSGPMIQSMNAANAIPRPSPLLDPRKGAQLHGQRSTEPKSRKRKKVPASEDSGQVIMHSQSQMESVSVPIVTSLVSTSVAIVTPASVMSKASMEKVIMPLSPSISTSHLKKGDWETQQRATLSEDTLSKLKEARTQAEDAAACAAAALSQSQEMWNQLEKQKNSGLVLDVESKLASAAVAIAAAAAVAKAAAAAANVASGAAMQAKLMADEALHSNGHSNPSQSNAPSLSDTVKDLGKATPASILKGEKAISGSSSAIFAAREAARRQLEAASAASKRAENMDAIVKAAELAAEAVSQAGKIVAMGDPLPLSDLIEAGLEGYWKVPQASTQMIVKSNNVNGEKSNMDNIREGPDNSANSSKEIPLGNREMHTTNQGKSPTLRDISGESFEEGARLVDGFSSPVAVSGKSTKGHKGGKASDFARNIGGVPESETGSRSASTNNQIEQEKEVEPSKENSIKEGSQVEVFKEGVQSKAGWFTANVLSLKDGKAYVCYSELSSGSEKLKEWVVLNGEGDEAPKIRIARPITAIPFEGTRKRRRAAMGEYTWSVGDRVDAWMGNSWEEGVVTEKNKKDETLFTVRFQVRGETATLRAWNLRPSLIWKDGEWIEWSASTENNQASHEGDTPQEKRPRLANPAVQSKGKDKVSKVIGFMESMKPDEPTLLDLSASEKIFNIGKNTRDENKPDTLRMIRAGLQKEGSGVVFGVPKPGKKRKFMEVSKHYVVDQAGKSSGANDSVKFAKYLIPQGQASGSRGWKNASRSEPKEKRAAVSKPKVLKSGKPPNVSGRTIPQKDNLVSSSMPAPDDGGAVDHMAKIKNSSRHVDTTTGKNDLSEFQSIMSTAEGAPEGPILFTSMPLSSDTTSKKASASNPKTERVTKGKLAPAGGKLTKIEEDKVFSGNSAKSTSELVEPRRSNRRIQPTSRLLEGLQSSLIISKIPSVSHDKSHKSQIRNVPKRE
ncbi:uncharacterized protein LOC123211201 isoform X2 [Mangifera indica]|uniref:uncharacterized protein LOC123211201 isoform X2 n=1 Tax=Mangifera indica TaxID=29780 RepID=UPI001CFB816C|nr:uncharacterized protein LOC123211201 isoform X2 [Mangifera indica]